MMRIFTFLIGLLAAFQINAQILDPVSFETRVKELSGNRAELCVKVIMEEGWHIYDFDKPEDSYVISSEYLLDESDDFKIISGPNGPKPHEEYDSLFEEVLKYHEGVAEFKYLIEKLGTSDFNVSGEFYYQTCNDRTCLSPTGEDLNFSVQAVKTVKKPNERPIEEQSLEEENTATNTTEDQQEAEENNTAATIASKADEDALEIDYSQEQEETTNTGEEANIEESSTTEGGKEGKNRSLIGIFVLSFLGGFAALLTPCVFPMIPLTVSFFTKQSKTRAKGITNAIIYGLAIIVLYTLIGLAVTAAFGSDALNALSTNPYMNIFFFVLLVVFAISFFGAFEITLPSKWVNKADQASDKGGIVGIFFMAFTLALVSFSCTGPIIGTLLVEAASGGYQGPAIGMFGFSLALALPFALFAAFPGWLNSLPKSGGWLNSVKVVLGFIELAFAFKFLSTADLVWQAGILKREWFIAIWIAIFALLTMYLLGKFRMPHDSPSEKTSVTKLILSVITLSFTIYLIPGLWGAPLKLISGFPPPMFYSESPKGLQVANGAPVLSSLTNNDAGIPKGADPEHCPHQLNCFHDYEEGLAYAKEAGKPILLDFTGWGCVNCRKMEEQVWSDPRVLDILRNDVVLISLYVDEREKLPEEEQFVSDITGKKIKTIGNKWSEFQIRHYQSNSQPQYVIVNHESMEPLNGTTAYDPDIQFYIDWLEEGINKF